MLTGARVGLDQFTCPLKIENTRGASYSYYGDTDFAKADQPSLAEDVHSNKSN